MPRLRSVLVPLAAVLGALLLIATPAQAHDGHPAPASSDSLLHQLSWAHLFGALAVLGAVAVGLVLLRARRRATEAARRR